MVVAFSVVSISNCSLEIPRCDSELTGGVSPSPATLTPLPVYHPVSGTLFAVVYDFWKHNQKCHFLYFCTSLVVWRGIRPPPFHTSHPPPTPGLLRRRLPMVFLTSRTLGNTGLTQRIISCMSSDECEFLMLVTLSHLTAVPLALCLVYEFGIACHRFCISCSPITLSFVTYVWFVSDDGEL